MINSKVQFKKVVNYISEKYSFINYTTSIITTMLSTTILKILQITTTLYIKLLFTYLYIRLSTLEIIKKIFPRIFFDLKLTHIDFKYFDFFRKYF